MCCQAGSVCSLSFLLAEVRSMSFPLRTVFIVSHKFTYVVASFSLNSKKSLISLFISSLTKLSLRRVVVQLQREFLLFMLLLKINLSPW